MKKVLLICVLAVVSCTKKSVDVNDLAGYWEIQKVLAPGKEKKEYKINETFDHFSVVGGKGERSKVYPQFDGTFLVNDKPEKFTVIEKDGDVFLHYSTSLAKWKEQVIMLEDSILVVKNAQDFEFYYKKTGPLNFTGNGKEIK